MGFVVKVDGEGLVQWGQKVVSPVYGVVEVGVDRYLMFGFSEVICLDGSGRMLWAESYSKFAEGFESLAAVRGHSVRMFVFGFVVGGVEGDGLVVAVPYGVSGRVTSCLWVGGFCCCVFFFWVFFSLFSCGVVVVVVVFSVMVVVGLLLCFWVYLKKCRHA